MRDLHYINEWEDKIIKVIILLILTYKFSKT